MSVKVTGIKALNVALKKGMNKDAVKQAVKLNGSELQTKAQKNAPVAAVRGGTLKSSIGLEISNNGLTATVEATAEYAPYQEYGTRFMEAQPFTAPAFNEQKVLFRKDLDRLMR